MAAVFRFTVFADINCPFCYALNEYFHVLGLDTLIEWRPIQHAPTISSDQCSYDILCELATEVAEVRRRAPSIEIRTPSFRPNSRLASEILTKASLMDPVRGSELRMLVYRALWLENLDISDPTVLEKLVSAIGFKPLSICQQTKTNLALWQVEWEQADYEGNIPVTVASGNERLVGFPRVQDLDSFISTRVRSDITHSAACAKKPKQRLLIFDSDPVSIQTIMSVMGDYEIKLVENAAELYEGLKTSLPADLVIMDMNTLERESSDLLTTIKTEPLLQNTPVVMVAKDTEVNREEIAFESGASDFIRKPFSRTVLTKRLTAQMQMIQSRKLLEKMARLDALTNIYNRREFDTRFQVEWDRCGRSGVGLSILMIDIDNFKEFNDNYGHHRGDECIKQIANILTTSICRPGDLLARYGGEEFVAILVNTNEEDSFTVAERCRRNVENERIIHEHSVVAKFVTVSIGCATGAPGRDINPLSILELADLALYKAKESGRNQISGTPRSVQSLTPKKEK